VEGKKVENEKRRKAERKSLHETERYEVVEKERERERG